jgi:hypothetical protein
LAEARNAKQQKTDYQLFKTKNVSYAEMALSAWRVSFISKAAEYYVALEKKRPQRKAGCQYWASIMGDENDGEII